MAHPSRCTFFLVKTDNRINCPFCHQKLKQLKFPCLDTYLLVGSFCKHDETILLKSLENFPDCNRTGEIRWERRQWFLKLLTKVWIVFVKATGGRIFLQDHQHHLHGTHSLVFRRGYYLSPYPRSNTVRSFRNEGFLSRINLQNKPPGTWNEASSCRKITLLQMSTKFGKIHVQSEPTLKRCYPATFHH